MVQWSTARAHPLIRLTTYYPMKDFVVISMLAIRRDVAQSMDMRFSGAQLFMPISLPVTFSMFYHLWSSVDMMKHKSIGPLECRCWSSRRPYLLPATWRTWHNYMYFLHVQNRMPSPAPVPWWSICLSICHSSSIMTYLLQNRWTMNRWTDLLT